MHQDDWAILIFTILFIVIYGAYKTRDNKNIQSFLKGNNSSEWREYATKCMIEILDNKV